MTDAAEGRVRESFARQAFMGLLGAAGLGAYNNVNLMPQQNGGLLSDEQ